MVKLKSTINTNPAPVESPTALTGKHRPSLFYQKLDVLVSKIYNLEEMNKDCMSSKAAKRKVTALQHISDRLKFT